MRTEDSGSKAATNWTVSPTSAFTDLGVKKGSYVGESLGRSRRTICVARMQATNGLESSSDRNRSIAKAILMQNEFAMEYCYINTYTCIAFRNAPSSYRKNANCGTATAQPLAVHGAKNTQRLPHQKSLGETQSQSLRTT